MTDATAGEMSTDAAPTIKVWDRVVRVFHWSLVATFAIAWVTAEGMARVHEWAGYIVGVLIGLRLIWGLVGTRYARFSQFVRAPSTVIAYLRSMKEGRERRYIGHNPAGGVMILVILASLIGTIVSGWMTTLDRFWGAEWVDLLHSGFTSLMMVLVIAHLVGVVLASLRHRENLARAMMTGVKRPPEGDDVA